MHKLIQIGLIMLFMAIGTQAGAHSLWLNMDGPPQGAGQPVTVHIGWGHKFPKDTEIKDGMLNEIAAIDSKGNRFPLSRTSQSSFEFVPEHEGVYLIAANVHPGFVSKTTEGYKLGPKSQFEQVVSCFHYDIRTRTFLRAGKDGALPDSKTGDPLEIIPVRDPLDVKTGTDFAVKVLFRDKPLSGAKVCATYAGFSDKPSTFAATVLTDSSGCASIPITHPGPWLVSVTHEIPYPNRAECDTNKYNATMTFDVQ